jgi:hypothetical protein
MSKVQIKQINGLEQRLTDVNGNLKIILTQSNHNFIVGRIVAFYNGNWVYADANDEGKLGRIVVEEILDTNTFVGILSGVITVSTWNLTPSAYYYVDGTGDGTITTSIEGISYSNPILQAITPTVAHVLSWRPSENVTPEPDPGLTQEYTQYGIPTVTSGNYSSTGITLDFEPINDSTIQVYVNGNAIIESYQDREGQCYFSSDNGQTAKRLTTITAGDTLYWNGLISGYNLDSADYISMVYHKNVLDV